MLSERVLDELVRSSALSEALSKALWPDLTVESKLQLLVAYQAGFSPTTPDWLTDLALEDKSPVVQYFALRHAYLPTRKEGLAAEIDELIQPSEEDVARHAKAHSIEHPLVKVAISGFSLLAVNVCLRHSSQLARLALVRNANMLSLSAFMDFLEEAVDQLDDREAAAVAYEYFLRPDAKQELQRGAFGFSDGESAYFAGKGMERGWEVVRKAGPVLANVLVTNLPTLLGMATVEPKYLATMPERVLELLAYDNSGRKEVGDLHKMMRQQPDRFPKKAIEALESASEFGRSDDAALQRERWLDGLPPVSRTVCLAH